MSSLIRSYRVKAVTLHLMIVFSNVVFHLKCGHLLNSTGNAVSKAMLGRGRKRQGWIKRVVMVVG